MSARPVDPGHRLPDKDWEKVVADASRIRAEHEKLQRGEVSEDGGTDHQHAE